MKQFIQNLGLLVAFLTLPITAFAQDATGIWRTEATERGHLEIEISSCGAMYCGTIVGARGPQGQTGPYEHMGRRLIWDMQPDGAGSWSGGKIWDPRNGRSYNSRMTLSGGQLTVSGCLLSVCKSQVWRRVR